ncbi:hypothetical protein F183_A35240 [Bryobacterales bacterium F-183]|nr:hypothetical protein F183_A35240 [Bryobacterales bacterium F-183]
MHFALVATLELDNIERFFNTSTKELTEEMSNFSPAPGVMTAAQQVAHAAQTIDWFVEGAFRPEGFDMDFEAHAKLIEGVTSLAVAREWFAKSIANAKAILGSKSDEELASPLPDGPIMGGAPRFSIVSGMTDHTAHHRGALTIYARLNSKTPPMPYA